jgi:hypothetical protein
MTNNAKRLLTEACLLPEEMPDNFTFNKVREILNGLERFETGELREAIAIAVRHKITGPLAAAIFVKHHLEGAHDVEIDRTEEGEEGSVFAVLVYPEGALPIRIEHLPQNISPGAQLHYDASLGEYQLK